VGFEIRKTTQVYTFNNQNIMVKWTKVLQPQEVPLSDK